MTISLYFLLSAYALLRKGKRRSILGQLYQVSNTNFNTFSNGLPKQSCAKTDNATYPQ